MIDRLRSATALVLHRLAHRIDGHWLYLVDSEISNSTWATWDWAHDYDQDQLLEVATRVLLEENKRMHRAQLAAWWVFQTYERHNKNPFKNIYWLFKGIHRSWLDISMKAATTRGRPID